jgi:hypothetical protein
MCRLVKTRSEPTALMKSPVTTLPCLAGLPLLPINPAWIEQSAAFRHADPRIALAYVKLVIAAWRGSPAASIPAAHSYLASATGLPLDVVGQEFMTLTEGYELRDDGRLHHIQLANVLAGVVSRYGSVLDEFMLSATMSAQDPEQFALVAAEGAKPTTKGKRPLPRGFGYDMHPGLREWARSTHFPEERDQDWIMRKFLDYCASRNPSYKDWEATFRTWAEKEVVSFKAVPPGVMERRQNGAPRNGLGLQSSPFASIAARGKGDVARDHNAHVFSQVASRRPPPPDADFADAEPMRPRGC